MNMVDPTGFWGGELHYNMTQWIFAEFGFNSHHANVVAQANVANEIKDEGYLDGSGYHVNPMIYNYGSMYDAFSGGDDQKATKLSFNDIVAMVNDDLPSIMYYRAHFNVPIGYIYDFNSGVQTVLARDSNYYLESYNFDELGRCNLVTFIRE